MNGPACALHRLPSRCPHRSSPTRVALLPHAWSPKRTNPIAQAHTPRRCLCPSHPKQAPAPLTVPCSRTHPCHYASTWGLNRHTRRRKCGRKHNHSCMYRLLRLSILRRFLHLPKALGRNPSTKASKLSRAATVPERRTSTHAFHGLCFLGRMSDQTSTFRTAQRVKCGHLCPRVFQQLPSRPRFSNRTHLPSGTAGGQPEQLAPEFLFLRCSSTLDPTGAHFAFLPLSLCTIPVTVPHEKPLCGGSHAKTRGTQLVCTLYKTKPAILHRPLRLYSDPETEIQALISSELQTSGCSSKGQRSRPKRSRQGPRAKLCPHSRRTVVPASP